MIETIDRCPLCNAPMDPTTQDPEQPFCDICCGFLLAELRAKRVVLVDPLTTDGAGGVSNTWAPPDDIDGMSDLERGMPRRGR